VFKFLCFYPSILAALPNGCSNLHQEGVEFFLKVWSQILRKKVDKTTFGDTEMFNAQLVAA